MDTSNKITPTLKYYGDFIGLTRLATSLNDPDYGWFYAAWADSRTGITCASTSEQNFSAGVAFSYSP